MSSINLSFSKIAKFLDSVVRFNLVSFESSLMVISDERLTDFNKEYYVTLIRDFCKASSYKFVSALAAFLVEIQIQGSAGIK